MESGGQLFYSTCTASTYCEVANDSNERQPSAKRQRKEQFRFSCKDDIILLKEVMANNPYVAKYGTKTMEWKKVEEGFNNAICLTKSNRPLVSADTLKNHCDGLIEAFQKSENEAPKRSGVDEDYEEREQLLRDLLDIIHDEADIREGERNKKA